MGLKFDSSNNRITEGSFKVIHTEPLSHLNGFDPIICAGNAMTINIPGYTYYTSLSYTDNDVITISKLDAEKQLIVSFKKECHASKVPDISFEFEGGNPGSRNITIDGTFSISKVYTAIWVGTITLTEHSYSHAVKTVPSQTFTIGKQKVDSNLEYKTSSTLTGFTIERVALKSIQGTAWLTYGRDYDQKTKTIDLSNATCSGNSFSLKGGNYNTLKGQVKYSSDGSSLILYNIHNLNPVAADGSDYFHHIEVTKYTTNVTYQTSSNETFKQERWSTLNYYNDEESIPLWFDSDTKINGFLTVIGEVK